MNKIGINLFSKQFIKFGGIINHFQSSVVRHGKELFYYKEREELERFARFKNESNSRFLFTFFNKHD